MTILIYLFYSSLAIGQLISFTIAPNLVIYLHDLFLGLLLTLSLFKYFFKTAKQLILPKLAIPIAMFICIALFSLLLNINRFGLIMTAIGGLYLVRFVFYTSIYFTVFYSLITKKTWLKLLSLFGFGIVVLGLLQYIIYPDLRNLAYLGWDPHYYRLFSTLLDPNFTGLILVLNIFLSLSYLNKQNKSWIFLVLVVNLIAVYLTYSRSTYLALIAGTIMFGFFSNYRKHLFALLMIFVIAVLVLPTPGGKTLKLLRDDTTLARVGNWKRGLELFYESPILGQGFNMLREIQTRKGWITDQSIVSHAGAGLDNSFLFVLVTTGFSGLTIYFWLIISQFKLAILRIKNKNSHLMGAIYLASLTAVIIHSFFNNSLFYPWLMIWLWTLAGVVEKSK